MLLPFHTHLQPSACYYRFTHIFNHQHAITVPHTSSTHQHAITVSTHLQPSACYYRFKHIFNHQHAITVPYTSSTISMLLQFHTHLQPSACYYNFTHIFNTLSMLLQFPYTSSNHQHAITISHTSSTISMLLQFHTHLQPSACYYRPTHFSTPLACYYSSAHIFNHQHAITNPHTSQHISNAITILCIVYVTSRHHNIIIWEYLHTLLLYWHWISHTITLPSCSTS